MSAVRVDISPLTDSRKRVSLSNEKCNVLIDSF